MSARIITDFSFLRRGRYGILEPPVDAPVMKSPKIVIVPGLLFDREGHRLGHGGGYYDRWLAKEGPNGRIIGLCRPERLVERLPRDSWDARVDEVVIGGAICL
jgi:5-formyltetrahydrofolate cyclo-ligase